MRYRYQPAFCIRSALVLVASLASARSAVAHGGDDHHGELVGPHNWNELWHTWGLEPGVIIPLVVTAVLYARGQSILWRAGGAGRGIRVSEAASFWLGWLGLVVALVSPLHPWGSVLFSAHMTQHEILMLVAAPLLVLGRPLIAILCALPTHWSHAAVRWSRRPCWRPIWSFLINPFVAWTVHFAVLWAWHVPALFQATIDNEWIHATPAHEFSFFGIALLVGRLAIAAPGRRVWNGRSLPVYHGRP